MNRSNILIFIFLVMFESYLDPDVTLCGRPLGKLLLLAHHVLSVYILTGSFLLGSPELHFVISIAIILLWLKYNRCVTTIYNNKLCNFDSNYKFKNFFYHARNILNVKHFVAEAFLFKIFLLLVLDLYLIMKDTYNYDITELLTNQMNLSNMETI